MTIFDSIKYPISDKMRISELKNIPNHIWEAWMNSEPRTNLSNLDFASNNLEYVTALRKFILEWEDDNI